MSPELLLGFLQSDSVGEMKSTPLYLSSSTFPG